MNKDVQIAEYFKPSTLGDIPITEGDTKLYIEWSSEGNHKDKVKLSHFNDGFNALVSGKRRAGLTMRLWEQGVLEGVTPYYTLLGGEGDEMPPRFVVEFMKKEMFKGLDAQLIEDCYSGIEALNT